MKSRLPEWSISGDACIFFALLLLTVPLPWILAAVAAACFHELCHIAVILCLGGTVEKISVHGGGAIIETKLQNASRELLAAAAGPAGSLLLMILLRRFPRLAVCGLIQGLYNLLPVWPMDGGRILSGLLFLLLPEERAGRISQQISAFVLVASFLGVLLCCRKYSWGYLAVTALILCIFKGFVGKIPCKVGKLRVQ